MRFAKGNPDAKAECGRSNCKRNDSSYFRRIALWHGAPFPGVVVVQHAHGTIVAHGRCA